MTTLTQAHRQWASRPADQRFTSLTELQAFAALSRQTSRSRVVSTREIELFPAADDHRGLLIGDRDGTQAAPTHWSFGQLCSLASTPSPASYFRDSRLPTPIIADCLNFNLRFTRGVEDDQAPGLQARMAMSSSAPPPVPATAASGMPMWSTLSSSVSAMASRDTGACRASSASGSPSTRATRPSTRAIATCSCSSPTRIGASSSRTAVMANRDRSPAASSCGELGGRQYHARRRVLPLRLCLLEPLRLGCGPVHRDPHPPYRRRARPLARRGDPGPSRIRGGQRQAGLAGDRGRPVQTDRGRSRPVPGKAFRQILVPALKAVHETEEGRPIETLWDVTVAAATAHARSLPNNDKRLELERSAGELLNPAA